MVWLAWLGRGIFWWGALGVRRLLLAHPYWCFSEQELLYCSLVDMLLRGSNSSHFEQQRCAYGIRPVKSSPCGIQPFDSLGIPLYKTFHHLCVEEHYFYAVLLTVCRCESSGGRVKRPDINSTPFVSPRSFIRFFSFLLSHLFTDSYSVRAN